MNLTPVNRSASGVTTRVSDSSQLPPEGGLTIAPQTLHPATLAVDALACSQHNECLLGAQDGRRLDSPLKERDCASFLFKRLLTWFFLVFSQASMTAFISSSLIFLLSPSKWGISTLFKKKTSSRGVSSMISHLFAGEEAEVLLLCSSKITLSLEICVGPGFLYPINQPSTVVRGNPLRIKSS